jgi:hypothetical protein
VALATQTFPEVTKKSKTPEKCKLPRRCLLPVTGKCPSTPLHVQVTAAKRGEDNFRIAVYNPGVIAWRLNRNAEYTFYR